MLTLVDGHRILIMHANSAIVFAAKRVQYSRVSHKASVKRTQYTHTHTVNNRRKMLACRV